MRPRLARLRPAERPAETPLALIMNAWNVHAVGALTVNQRVGSAVQELRAEHNAGVIMACVSP